MAFSDGFCNTPFWNSSSAWYAERPDLTSCFQDTVLVWVPCAWLWFSSSFHAYYVIKNRGPPLPISWLYKCKLIGSAVFILSTLLTLSFQIWDHTINGRAGVHSDVMASGLLLLTVLLATFLTVLDQRKRCITSGTRFVFWLLMAMAGIINCYSAVLNETPHSQAALLVLGLCRLLSTLLLLLLHGFAETLPPSPAGPTGCPLTHASFLSRLTFCWMNQTMLRGYRSALTEERVDPLPPAQLTSSIPPSFLRPWQHHHHHHQQPQPACSTPGGSATSLELQPRPHQALHNNHIADNDNAKNDEEADITDDGYGVGAAVDADRGRRQGGEGGRGGHLSLVRLLARSFGRETVVLQVWQILHDALLLLNPLLVGMLIRFIDDREAPGWRGSVLSGALFASIVVQSVLAKQTEYWAGALALRVGTALTSVIYRKALRLDRSGDQRTTVGETVNLMTSDTRCVQEAMKGVFNLWSGPLQVVLSLAFLLHILGPSLLAGLAVMLVLTPLYVVALKYIQKVEDDLMTIKDSRLNILSEVVDGINIVKMYAQEAAFGRKMQRTREKELRFVFRLSCLESGVECIWTLAPFMVSMAVFVTYIYSSDNHLLQPDTAFVTLIFLNIIKHALTDSSPVVVDFIKAFVSFRRLNAYFNQSELDLDNVFKTPHTPNSENDLDICIDHASFTWGPALGPALCDVTLRVPPGQLVVVVGPVGAGKSSLLAAMLGELRRLSGEATVKGSTAYVPQQAWIQNASLRDNVLFGRPMHEPLYHSCLHACDLGPDLDLLPGADLTEIGEKGVNLSGGQKQRVSLARAAYSQRDLYLLDDPLSAVDAHVSKRIFRHVLGPHGLLATKTRIMVTHGLQWLPYADVIVMMQKGRVTEVGSYSELLRHNGPLTQFLRKSLITSETQSEKTDQEVQGITYQMLEQLRPVSDDVTPSLKYTVKNGAHVSVKHEDDSDSVNLNTSRRNTASGARVRVTPKQPIKVNESCCELEVTENPRCRLLPCEAAGPVDSRNDFRNQGDADQDSIGVQDLGPFREGDVDVCGRQDDGEGGFSPKLRPLLARPTSNDNVTDRREHGGKEGSERGSGNGVDYSKDRRSLLVLPVADDEEEEEGRDGDRETLRLERVRQNMADNKHVLVPEEALEEKGVGWAVYRQLLRTIGGAYVVLSLLTYSLYYAAYVTSDIFLSQWTDDSRLSNLSVLPANSSERMDLNRHYLSLYGGFGAVQVLMMVAVRILLARRFLNVARCVHRDLLTSVLHAPLTFFHTTPLGRVVNRFSGELFTVDVQLPSSCTALVHTTLDVITCLVVITLSTHWFLVAVIPLIAAYVIVQRFYMPTSRQLRRLGSKRLSPLYSFFAETLTGTVTVRAYGAQGRFLREMEARIYETTRFRFYSLCAERWLGFNLDMLGGIVVLVTSLTTVSLRHIMSPGLVGLAVTYALDMTSHLYGFVTALGDVETDMVSLERIAEMTSIEPEAQWTMPSHHPGPEWPQKGNIEVTDLQVRYRSDLDPVLDGVTFSIKDEEKVGVVGRTGAGKSTLTLALFRLLEAAGGNVTIDGLDIASIGLHDLRSRLAVLPQDPVVFAGSVRSNLDPWDEFKDSDLWSALEHAHIKAFVVGQPMGLQAECGQRGDNLSLGQKQLLCLARTLLRKTRILILDEATASVDMATDELIQKTIRTEFADCTVVTIAHRLNTVMDYDRILVLEEGRATHFDSPSNLLQSQDNLFSKMAADAGLVNHT